MDRAAARDVAVPTGQSNHETLVSNQCSQIAKCAFCTFIESHHVIDQCSWNCPDCSRTLALESSSASASASASASVQADHNPQRSNSDCFTTISEEYIECDSTASEPATICGPACPPLPVCDKADCKPYSYCDICEIDHVEFDLLGQPQSFWSPSSAESSHHKDKLQGSSGAKTAVVEASLEDSFAPMVTWTLAPAIPTTQSPSPLETDHSQHHFAFSKPLAAPALHHVPPTDHHHHSVTAIRPEQVPVLSSFSSITSFATPPTSTPMPLVTTFPPAIPRRSNNPASSPCQCRWIDTSNTICNLLFPSPAALHEHLKHHHHASTSPYCRWAGCKCNHLTVHPHRFASGSCLRHTYGHTHYRPYICPLCPNHLGFAAADIRDEHVANIHLGQKLYTCDVPGCNHESAGLSNLRRHKQDKHAAEQFQCEFCWRMGHKRRLFPRAQNLRRHFRTCKFVAAEFPDAHRVEGDQGGLCVDWFPPGYGSGHGGMNRAKVKVTS